MSASFVESIKKGVSCVLLDIVHVMKILLLDPCQWVVSQLSGTSTQSKLQKFYEGKVIVITGASSGIGESLTRILASIPRTTVIVTARRKEKLDEVASSCRLRYPSSQIYPVLLDLENWKTGDVANYVKKVMETLKANGNPNPRIDVLVNNAGISSRGGAMETTMPTLEKLMNVNFFGPVALTQTVAASMIDNGGGAIGVVSSVQGKLGIPWRSSYAASKHALQGYFDSLRAELAALKVSVTVVSPGYVKTSLSLNALNADGSQYNKLDETTASGMESDQVAEQVLLSIAQKEVDVVLADSKTCAALQMKSTLPELLSVIMRKRAEKR